MNHNAATNGLHPEQPIPQKFWSRTAVSLFNRSLHRPIFLFAIGFTAGSALELNIPLAPAIAIIAVSISLFVLLLNTSKPAIISAVVLLGLGAGLARTETVINTELRDQNCAHFPGLATIIAVVIENPTLFAHENTLNVRLISLDSPFAHLPVQSTLTVNFTPRSLPDKYPQPGDMIRSDGLLQFGQRSQNPTFGVDKFSSIEIIGQDPAFHFQRFANTCRVYCVARLNQLLSRQDSAFAGAILLGSRTDLDPEIKADFLNTGTVHLLATAGLHIGIFLIILRYFFMAITIPPKIAAGLSIVFVWLYATAAGGHPAVTRAAFVATLYLIAIIIERIPDLLTAISLCASVLIWNDPHILIEPGFQLTFCTVLGIMALMPALMAVCKPILEKIKNPKARIAVKQSIEIENLSLAAQASSAPIVADHFNLVSVFGVGANMLAVPCLFVIIPASILSIGISTISLPIARFIAEILLAPSLHIAIAVIRLISSLPNCAVSVQAPSIASICLYYVVLLGGSFAIQTRAS